MRIHPVKRGDIPFAVQKGLALWAPPLAENASFISMGVYLASFTDLGTAWAISFLLTTAHILGTWRSSIFASVQARWIKLRPFSWSDGSISFAVTASILGTALSTLFMEIAFASGFALNICYSIIKVRCFINRCCETRRENFFAAKLLKDTIPLHVFESVFSLSSALLGLALLQLSTALAAATLWLCHFVVRGTNRFMRSRAAQPIALVEAETFTILIFSLVIAAIGIAS